MAKRILILSDPPAAPGYLPRLRFLCEFLAQRGYDVTLLTERYQPLPFEHSYPIVTIHMYSGGGWDWFVKTVWTLLSDWHNRVFAKRSLQQASINGKHFDTVLCSSFSDFPLGAGLRLARHFGARFVCDIRDLDEQVDDSRYQYRHQQNWLMPFRRLYRAIHIRRRNKVLRQADAITTVSPWHVDFIRRLNPHTHLMYNGFDEAQFYPKDTPTDTFRITYIGSLFDWQQPALEKVKEVIEKLNKSEIKNQKSEILLDIHTPQEQPVAYTRLGDAIRQSSIMLVFTHPSTHGLMTTKFFEALGCEKPILCVPSDNGCLADTIHETNAGIATENVETIRQFILDQYHEWQEKGFTRRPVVHKEIFSRNYQSSLIEALL